jgi:hypothetical protein
MMTRDTDSPSLPRLWLEDLPPFSIDNGVRKQASGENAMVEMLVEPGGGLIAAGGSLEKVFPVALFTSDRIEF